jgi:hypothetical protein
MDKIKDYISKAQLMYARTDKRVRIGVASIIVIIIIAIII